MTPAIFLDKDGTLLVDVPYNVDPARMQLAPGADAALRAFASLGLPLFVITNQPGVALGLFEPAALVDVERRLAAMFDEQGASLEGFYHCPHHIDGEVAEYRVACECRKPMPGLLRRAAAEHDIDLAGSWFVGDILHDVEAGRRAGCRTILIDNGNETEWRADPVEPRRRIPDHAVPDLEAAATIIAASFGLSDRASPGRLPASTSAASEGAAAKEAVAAEEVAGQEFTDEAVAAEEVGVGSSCAVGIAGHRRPLTNFKEAR